MVWCHFGKLLPRCPRPRYGSLPVCRGDVSRGPNWHRLYVGSQRVERAAVVCGHADDDGGGGRRRFVVGVAAGAAGELAGADGKTV